MGILFIPPNNAAIRSMVRLPDSGWNTSLPSSVLDLSRSSGIAATVRVGPFPFITRNTVGASGAANSTNTDKLSEAAPNRQTREGESKERESIRQKSENSPSEGVANAEERQLLVPVSSSSIEKGPQHVTSENGFNLETGRKRAHLTTVPDKQSAKRSDSQETVPKEEPSAKRFKSQQALPMKSSPKQIQNFMVSVSNQTSSNLTVKPTQVQAVILVNGSGTPQSQYGLKNSSNMSIRRNLVTSQSFSSMKGCTVPRSFVTNQVNDLKGLQQEAMELRAANNHLKQRLANYQNLFKDKKKLQTVIEILYNNQQPNQ